MTTIAPPTLAFADVAFEPRYVLGFPIYVALTIQGAPPEASFPRMPLVDWVGTRGMVGVVLSPVGSDAIVHRVDPRPRVDGSMGIPLARLRGGEQRRMLVDLSEVLPASLDEGSYDVTVTFGPETIRAESARLRFGFRRPTPRERDELVSVEPERAARGSWGLWTWLPPIDAAKLRFPWGPEDPLRLNTILREMLHGPVALGDIPLDRLDALAGVLAPEREALRAELLVARGDAQAFSAQAAHVEQSFPGLSWWMAAVADGQSVFAWAREHRSP